MLSIDFLDEWGNFWASQSSNTIKRLYMAQHLTFRCLLHLLQRATPRYLSRFIGSILAWSGQKFPKKYCQRYFQTATKQKYLNLEHLDCLSLDNKRRNVWCRSIYNRLIAFADCEAEEFSRFSAGILYQELMLSNFFKVFFWNFAKDSSRNISKYFSRKHYLDLLRNSISFSSKISQKVFFKNSFSNF